MIIFTDIKSAVMPLEQVIVEDIKKYNPNAVYFRDKTISDERYLELAKKIMQICRLYNVKFYVCHRPEIALKLGVRNLHINLKNVPKIVTKDNFDNISVSIHCSDEIDIAKNIGATCLVFGHIYETNCKRDVAPRGVNQLSEICQKSQIPVIAIGGINRQNCEQILRAGAIDFAIMSSAMKLSF